MNLPTFTSADILSWGPCSGSLPLLAEYRGWWPVDKKLCGNALDILKHPDLEKHPDWKLWNVLREECLDSRTLRLFACDCAERALDKYGGDNVDPRSREAITVARNYANGKATTYAATYAACAARAAYATDAATDAATYAAYAATDAAYAATLARKNEMQWQVNHLIKMLEKE